MKLKIPNSVLEILRTYARYPKEIGIYFYEFYGDMFGDIETRVVTRAGYPHKKGGKWFRMAHLDPNYLGIYHTHHFTRGFSGTDLWTVKKLKSSNISLVLYWDPKNGHYEEAATSLDEIVKLEIETIDDKIDTKEIELAKSWIKKNKENFLGQTNRIIESRPEVIGELKREGIIP